MTQIYRHLLLRAEPTWWAGLALAPIAAWRSERYFCRHAHLSILACFDRRALGGRYARVRWAIRQSCLDGSQLPGANVSRPSGLLAAEPQPLSRAAPPWAGCWPPSRRRRRSSRSAMRQLDARERPIPYTLVESRAGPRTRHESFHAECWPAMQSLTHRFFLIR